MNGKATSPGKIWIDRELIESRAFLSLSGFAPHLLFFVLARRRYEKQGPKGREKWTIVNGASIHLTYAEFARKYRITGPKLTRAIDQLLSRGFLEVVHVGGGFQKDKSVYALSEKWTLWRPGLCFEAREKDTVNRGFRRPKNYFQHTKT